MSTDELSLPGALYTRDCLEYMREQDDDTFDLVFGSPPYESARSYGIGFSLSGQDWVDWMVECVTEASRICRGLVAVVVAGRTRNFRWSATPALLMADLHRAGIRLRRPVIFHRVGIPGSGGPDWLRADTEFVVCCSRGRLPWSDNTAMGQPPKYKPGGALSHWKTSTSGYSGGDTRVKQVNYTPPEKANPGNVVHCSVGGGKMGHSLAHENEAPFPSMLAEFFIRSFCPPDGLVLDPWCGSGTTCAVAAQCGRRFVGVDIRESQIELTYRRLCSKEPEALAIS
jgi:DNA modification methylase